MIVFDPMITNRRQLAELCNRQGLLGLAAEIGVNQGDFAVQFLKLWQGSKYFAVDPYRPTAQFPQPRDDDKRAAQLRLVDPRVQFVEWPGEEWLATLPDGSIDFIYIDADHSYAAADRQIRLAWPKVRRGGMLAGHDFHSAFPGVVRAVFEFAEREPLTVNITNDQYDGTLYSDIWSFYAFKSEALAC